MAGFEKRNVLELDLKKSREGFFWTGRGRLFDVEGLKMKKVHEPNGGK